MTDDRPTIWKVAPLLAAVSLAIAAAAAAPVLAAMPAKSLAYYRHVKERKPAVHEVELVVYGGTSAGAAAAIQAARMGRKTMLVSFDQHVGGLTSGGLAATDLGRKDTIGGVALEFYKRLGGMTNFSCAAAEKIFRTMLDEAGVTVLTGCPLESVAMQGSRIVSATFETGDTVKATMFIDASYEGDLLAAANVSYHVGREPRGTYGESLAGQWQKVSWKGVYQFCGLPISPYVTAGDPASGLLPEISPDKPGAAGDGDYRVQAFNFRMMLSNKPGSIPFAKPEGYDPARYGLLARFLADPQVTWTLNYTTRPMTDGPVQMRNGDSNNAGSFSSDYVGGSHRWPDGTFEAVNFSELPPPRRGLPVPLPELYRIREEIFQDHVRYQHGLMYFLANDPQVPDRLQQRVCAFGLDPREFKDTGHWPHQLYVREARRMVSDYVMTQADCESKRVAEDSVGLASYAMDSHFCQRVVVEENGATTVRNEGGFGHPPRHPYPVSYRSIIPKQAECENLLVPVCLSASHVAFGSIRMEPVFMILGQSAATAAALAIGDGISVQQLDYSKLAQRLLADGQKLATAAKDTPRRVLFIGNSYTSSHDLPGIFRRIVESAGEEVPEIKSHAPAGRTLLAQVRDPACKKLLEEGNWDVVVLQGQSQEAALAETSPKVREDFLAGGQELVRLARAKSPTARIVLFQTWARHPKFWEQQTADGGMGRDASEMLACIRKWYGKLAEAENCEVAPVGDAWMASDEGPEPVSLHSGDHSHPQYAGSYLTALVLYGTIYNPQRMKVPFRGPLSEADAARLQQVADRRASAVR